MIAGQNSWDEQLIRRIFYPHDADAIIQLKIPSGGVDDVLAWFPEKLGFFSVKSAYRLALDERTSADCGSSSGSPNGCRKFWEILWKTNVPPKIRVFAWKLANDSLGVQVHLAHRLKKTSPMCTICGLEKETSFHAVMSCPKVRCLRRRMRLDWNLPPESDLLRSGDDWVLVILDAVDAITRQRLLFLVASMAPNE